MCRLRTLPVNRLGRAAGRDFAEEPGHFLLEIADFDRGFRRFGCAVAAFIPPQGAEGGRDRCGSQRRALGALLTQPRAVGGNGGSSPFDEAVIPRPRRLLLIFFHRYINIS